MTGIDVEQAFPQTQTFVARDEREQLMEAFAELVYERGYELATLDDAAARAEVEPASAHIYFDDEADCALRTVELCGERCFSAVARAYMTAPGDCPLAAHRALRAMLEYMAGAPALVYLSVVELLRIGELAHRRRSRDLDLFAEFLGPGFAAAASAGRYLPQPEVNGQMIGGGIYEVLRRHAVERRLAELPKALPAISYLCTAPFFGVDEARRVIESA